MRDKMKTLNIYNLSKSISYLIKILVFTAQMSHAASLNLAWDANSEPDLAGYKIYYGISSGKYDTNIDVGKVTEYELSGLIENKIYYIALTAYDTCYNESEKSDEVSGTAQSPPTTSTISTTISSTTTSTVTTTTTTPVTTTIPSDDTPPIGTIIINNGDKVTHSPKVILTLFATDNGKELGEDALMTFSNDNQNWSNPETYTDTKLWTLTPDKGDKTVYVKFRDAAGNWMTEPAKDQIKLIVCQQKLKPISVITSSEFSPFWSKYNAVDENPLTFWSTIPTIFPKNEFITLDLGNIKQMTRIDIHALKFFTSDFFPLDFSIQTSRDNINWNEVSIEKSYTLKSNPFDSWELNHIQARYIRLYITKTKLFFIFHLVQIAEIEVYGCDLSEQNLTSVEDKSSIKEGEVKDDIQEEKGEVEELDQRPPSTPGRPVITFN